MTKSQLYAIQDGIKIEEGIARGGMKVNIYCIPCDKCGNIVKKQVYSSEKIYLCEYCKKGLARKKKQYIENELEQVKTKKEQAFEKAVERMELQVQNFNSYERAIQIAKTRVELYGSIPEVMVAIELIKLGYKIIPQQKIGRYKVDFLLPNEKLVIEVDGGLYHQSPHKGDREAVIQLSLGLDWKIIHIPAELISVDIKKLKVIIKKLATPGQKKYGNIVS